MRYIVQLSAIMAFLGHSWAGATLTLISPTLLQESQSLEASPFATDEETEEFLRTAKVVSRKRVDEGINDIYRVLLEKDGIQTYGAYRDVQVKKNFVRLANGKTQTNFRDDCVYEVAAYRLSRLLGLDNVPPVVRRKVGGKNGTLQLWVGDTMMEKERVKKRIRPPSPLQWMRQSQIMYLFDNLIFNEDRNTGNILIDPDWKLWMIDHTRAFRRDKKLRTPQTVRLCSRALWAKLTQLDEDQLRQEFDGILNKSEIEALLTRSDLMIKHIQKLIDQRGASAVLF